jgi:hypothetical protein
VLDVRRIEKSCPLKRRVMTIGNASLYTQAIKNRLPIESATGIPLGDDLAY